jgi:hypothetical protein
MASNGLPSSSSRICLTEVLERPRASMAIGPGATRLSGAGSGDMTTGSPAVAVVAPGPGADGPPVLEAGACSTPLARESERGSDAAGGGSPVGRESVGRSTSTQPLRNVHASTSNRSTMPNPPTGRRRVLVMHVLVMQAHGQRCLVPRYSRSTACRRLEPLARQHSYGRIVDENGSACPRAKVCGGQAARL